METLLVAQAIAPAGPARDRQDLRAQGRGDALLPGVEGDPRRRPASRSVKEATDEDFHTEWLAPVVSIRVVPGLDEAIAHIAKYGSQHTDAIVTEDWSRTRSASCARSIRAR